MTPQPAIAMPEPIHIISLGAGVQSSTMALMASDGQLLPKPQAAYFADTGDEPDDVYSWIDKLTPMLSFQVVRITHGNLRDHILNRHGTSIIPSWVSTVNGPKMGQKGCTNDFKVRPIRRELRKNYPDTHITLWLGISTDEATRIKDSGLLWLTHHWPLIDEGMNRQNCVAYLQRRGLKAPKSSCVYCPFKNRKQWKTIQQTASPRELGILKQVQDILTPRKEYLSSQLKPLEDCDFTSEEDRGQVNMFENECFGVCGV